MTTVTLLQAEPRDRATGAVVPVRLAGGGSRPFNQLGFSDWRSGLARPLRFASGIDFAQGGPQGSLPPTTRVRFRSAEPGLVGRLGQLIWAKARVELATGDDQSAGATFPTVLRGSVAGASVAENALQLTITDLSTELSRPLAATTFAGSGGIEGPAEATGRVKRRSFGYVFNVEGRILDTAASIYEFGDPGRPLNGFAAVKDKGRPASATVAVGWAGSVAATLAALKVAAVPKGGCAVAPSIACVKWWTQPVGPLTADLEGEVGAGYVATAAAIAASIVAELVPAVGTANLAEAIGWQGGVAGLHVDDANETATAALDRLLLPLFVVWVIDQVGALVFRRIGWDGAPVAALTGQTVEREAVLMPLRERRLGYRRNHRQHADSEISAALLDAQLEAVAAAVVVAQGTADTAAAKADAAAGGVAAIKAALPPLEAADRQLARDQVMLAQALLRALGEANTARTMLRDAGVLVDPDGGQVRIYGLDQVVNRTSKVELLVSAQAGQISAKASTEYVQQAIQAAQLPGAAANLDNIYARLTSAELAIGGTTATLALKADAATLTALSGTVTSLATTLDALAGTVSTKASTTAVGALEVRVGSAEQVLQSLDNVSSVGTDLRQARLTGAALAEATLRALLAGDDANTRQLVQLATARQELTTKIVDGLSAEAVARLQLSARMALAEADVLSEQAARVTEISAIAQAMTGVAARLGDAESSVQFLLSAANGNEATVQFVLKANGAITAIKVNGQSRSIVFDAETFTVEGVKPFTYNSTTGLLKLPGIEVDTIKVGSVDYDALRLGSVQKFAFYPLPQAVTIAAGATAQVEMTFFKEDRDSVLDIMFNGDFSSTDDLQFTGTIRIDGQVVRATGVNFEGVNANAAMPITPVGVVAGIAEGARTIQFQFTNNEAHGAPLTIGAGSVLRVNELRKASIGSVTGGGGVIVDPGAPVDPGTGGGAGSGGSGPSVPSFPPYRGRDRYEFEQ